MTTLGDYLRQERERRGITLEQLQEGTKIRLKYLKAMEEGRFEEAPGEVYLRGFLRSYAEFIGLEGADIVKRYQDGVQEELSQGSLEAQPPTQVGAAKGRAAARARRRLRRARALGVSVAALAMAVVGAVLIYNSVMGLPQEQTAGGATKLSSGGLMSGHAASSQVLADGATESPRGGPSASPASTSLASADVATRGVKVTTQGRVRSWIRVSEDGTQVYQGFLAKGQKKEWQATGSVEITFTNAGGVIATHNGSPLGTIGETGRVLTRSFGVDMRRSLPGSAQRSAGRSGRSTGTNASLGEVAPRFVAPSVPVAASVRVTALPSTQDAGAEVLVAPTVRAPTSPDASAATRAPASTDANKVGEAPSPGPAASGQAASSVPPDAVVSPDPALHPPSTVVDPEPQPPVADEPADAVSQ